MFVGFLFSGGAIKSVNGVFNEAQKSWDLQALSLTGNSFAVPALFSPSAWHLWEGTMDYY